MPANRSQANISYFTFLAIIFTAVLFVASEKTWASEEVAVKETFDQYKTALVKNDGKSAAEAVSLGTIADYESARKLALEADASELRKISITKRLIVLRLRLEYPYEELKKFSAKGIFVAAVNKGWIGKEGVLTSSLGKVTSSGDSAIGNIVVKGQEITDPNFPKYHFKKESGKWKIDLVAMNNMANAVLSKQVADSGMNENDFLLFVLTIVTKNKVDESVFQLNDYKAGLKKGEPFDPSELEKAIKSADEMLDETEKALDEK